MSWWRVAAAAALVHSSFPPSAGGGVVVSAHGLAPRHFLLLGTQRTGTTWVVAELDKAACIHARDELMLKRPGYTWTESRRQANLNYLYAGSPDAPPPPEANVKWQHFYKVLQKARATAPAPGVVAVGFKWMLEVRNHLEWLIPLWKKHDVRIIVLRRRNFLKTQVSRTANDRAPGHAHPTPGQAAAMSRVKFRLPTGRRLMDLLRFVEREFRDLKKLHAQLVDKKIQATLVMYEDLVAKPQKIDALASFVLGDDARARNCTQLTAVAAADGTNNASFKDLGKVHTMSLRDQLANYDDVVKTLRNTKFYTFIKEDEAEHHRRQLGDERRRLLGKKYKAHLNNTTNVGNTDPNRSNKRHQRTGR